MQLSCPPFFQRGPGTVDQLWHLSAFLIFKMYQTVSFMGSLWLGQRKVATCSALDGFGCWHAEKLPGSEPCRAMALFRSHSPKSWFSTTPSSSILQITLYDWCKDRLGLPGRTRNRSSPVSQLQSCKTFITTFQINGRDFSHPWFKMQSSPSCTTISFDKWSEATFHNFVLLFFRGSWLKHVETLKTGLRLGWFVVRYGVL